MLDQFKNMHKMMDPPGSPESRGTARAPAVPPRVQKSGFNIVDLKQYFHIVVKRIWLVALCFVTALAVMVVMLVREVPVYRASSQVLLTRGLDLPVREREVAYERGADFLQTQLRILNSREFLRRARERTGRPSREINEVLIGVNSHVVWRTSIIQINVTSLDPHFAAEFANAVAEEYLDFKAEERMDISQATVINLTHQANRIRDELTRAENRLMTFERENRIIAIRERGNIAAHNLANLSSQAARLRTQRLLLEAQQPLLTEASDEVILAALSSPYPMIANPGMTRPAMAGLSGESAEGRPAGEEEYGMGQTGPETLIDMGIIERPDWVSLRRQKSRLEADLEDLRTRFREAHPSIQDTLRKIREIDRNLDVELQFALRQYYSDLEALDIRYKAARRAELAWEEEAIEVARRAHEYQSLQRSVDRLRTMYDLIYRRLKDIDIAIGVEPETVQILQRATAPSSPSAPRKVTSVFMAALIGLGIGLGLVFGLEYIDDSVRYPEEVTEGIGIPFFGLIPSANWNPEDLRSHLLSNLEPKSGLAEAYRNVRSAFLFSGGADEGRSVVITSAVPKEGKTTTCLNLGVSLAQAGSRILVVDADLRRGELHKFFGVEAGRGFSDILAGQAKPESVIQRTGIPNLDMVATGPFPPNPAELMLKPELHSFIDYARKTYDRILFDCPPVMVVSEATILASQVDGVIMVIWAGQTSKKLAQLSAQVLHERGARIYGCVLNNLEFGRVGYYYYSTYYGYYDYDYRYEKQSANT